MVYACVLYRYGKADTRGFGIRLQIACEESWNRNRLWPRLDEHLDTRNMSMGSGFLPHENLAPEAKVCDARCLKGRPIEIFVVGHC